MRFTVSRALDAIERRLTTDPVLATAVVDLGSVVHHSGMDDGRPANLLRLGMVIDALARDLSDDSVTVYPVADRALLSDLELTSNEKMVIRRWADDGRADVVPEAADRALEVAELTGLPVISRRDLRAFRDRFPGIVGTSRHLVPMPGAGGAVLAQGGPGPGSVTPQGGAHPVLRRLWRCAELMCPPFGAPRGGQQPPTVRTGHPACPRHGRPLTDAGPAPEAVPMVVVIRGTARHRFAVRADRPVVVGRNPEEPGVRLGPLMDDRSAALISRSHLQLELTGGAMTVQDLSTNGTAVLARRGRDTPPERLTLRRGDRRVLGPWDTVELREGVELASARHWRGSGVVEPSSTLAEAPTVALRLPPER